jgi:hypothetical protein
LDVPIKILNFQRSTYNAQRSTKSKCSKLEVQSSAFSSAIPVILSQKSALYSLHKPQPAKSLSRRDDGSPCLHHPKFKITFSTVRIIARNISDTSLLD